MAIGEDMPTLPMHAGAVAGLLLSRYRAAAHMCSADIISLPTAANVNERCPQKSQFIVVSNSMCHMCMSYYIVRLVPPTFQGSQTLTWSL